MDSPWLTRMSSAVPVMLMALDLSDSKNELLYIFLAVFLSYSFEFLNMLSVWLDIKL